jgi:hypothetical protein
MANKEQYTAEQMITAIREANGMLTVAARRVGCTYNTIRRYVDNYPTVKQALDDTKQNLGDRIESTLLSQALGIRDSNTGEYTQEPNVTALIFLVKTHPVMRARGYTERVQQEHMGSINVEWVDPLGDDDEIGLGGDELPATD